MSAATDVRVLHETTGGLEGTPQHYRLVRTVEAAGQRLRAWVDVDGAYPRQSSYKAELWSGARWNPVVTIDPTDSWVTARTVSYVVRDPSLKRRALDAIADELVARALQVIG